MIRQAAVCIVRVLRSSTVTMILDAKPLDLDVAAAEMCPKFGWGRER